jgi:long-chain acyl-CoA synthetase
MARRARHPGRARATLIAVVRGRDDDDGQARLLEAASTVLPNPERHRDRLIALRGDVTQPGLGLSRQTRDELAEHVTEVVHSAASVSFALPLDEARAINVEGTRHVLELAELCHARGGHRRL